MPEDIERDVMEYDVVVVGGGPAGLSAAIRLKQLAAAAGSEVSVVVLEKGSEIGAHILSGAVVDPRGLAELFPDWSERGAPLATPVSEDRFLWLGPHGSVAFPMVLMPPLMSNHGCFIGSLADLCRWLGEQAEALGVDVFPGFAAAEPLYAEDGAIKGVRVGDMGVGKDRERKPGAFTPGVDIQAKYTIIAEGARGSLARRLIREFELGKGRDPQKYGLGVKELWKVPDASFKPGLVQHTMGWPLDNRTGGGGFLYHWGDNFVSVGFVVHLNYENPWLSPYEEFQRFKHHPAVLDHLRGGERVAYGARAITEGGWQSIPQLAFPGGVLAGCAAGFVNVPRIKGSHNAIKTGALAAESVFAALSQGRSCDRLEDYEPAFRESWAAKDLKTVRNVKPLWSKFGTALGVGLAGVDMWSRTIFGGWSPLGAMKHGKSDAETLKPAAEAKKIVYPKPDGVISFDKLTSVAFSFTNHEEDQPVHLLVRDPVLQKESEHDVYAGPSARYCPAGVYEWVETDSGVRYQINAQNCVHCKTCDIKDPNLNITWAPPEGGGGPNYPNM